MKLFVLGILFGWLVEWLFYILFWKQRDGDGEAKAHEIDRLKAALKSRDEEIARLKATPAEAPPAEPVKTRPASKPRSRPKKAADSSAASPKAKPSKAPGASPEKLLQKVSGIGPKVSAILVSKGIDSYAALADAGVEKLGAMLKEAGTRYAMIDVSSWPDQARLLDKGDEAGLAKLLESLKK